MRKVLFVLPLLLASCGYTPLYAPVGENLAFSKVEVGTVEMGNAKLLPGERRVAQRVAQKLRLDYPNHAATLDVLSINIQEYTATLAVEKTATTSRAEILLRGMLTLTSPEGKILLTANINSSSAYNVEDSPYSTETSKNFARLTAADNLAAEASRRVALFYVTTAAK